MRRYAEVTRYPCISGNFSLTRRPQRHNFFVYCTVFVCSPLPITAMRSNALVSMNLLNGARSGCNGVPTRRPRMWLG